MDKIYTPSSRVIAEKTCGTHDTAFPIAEDGVSHSSQPNISRPDGCRHPLLTRTSIQVN
ncbi:hypothetical protein ACWFRM_22965 [Streptomyces sp. NPDC055144]